MIRAASEIMKWGSIINCSAEVVEEGHKRWVKEQGKNTNQGDRAAKTMMNNSLQKIASMELTQAIKGRIMLKIIQLVLTLFTHFYLIYAFQLPNIQSLLAQTALTTGMVLSATRNGSEFAMRTGMK
jgi:hypothetical protein